MAKKKKKRRSNSFSLPSAATLAQAATAGLFLTARQNSIGQPLHEFGSGNFGKGAHALLVNSKEMITTADGWTQVMLPVIAIQLVKRMLPRVRVNLFGMRWSII